ncbi:MAG: hypothetical protein KAI40_10330 [Desulfobacterales bacterium]|nr:hypothetical protein [Desulfobacterales bacterium]
MRNQLKKINVYLFLFIIGILLLGSCQNIESSNRIPKIEKGVIDLRDWDFDKNGAVNLKGQWEFYWKEHKLPDEFIDNNSDSEPVYIGVPGIWNDFVNKGENLPGLGFATYRARVL